MSLIIIISSMFYKHKDISPTCMCSRVTFQIKRIVEPFAALYTYVPLDVAVAFDMAVQHPLLREDLLADETLVLLFAHGCSQLGYKNIKQMLIHLIWQISNYFIFCLNQTNNSYKLSLNFAAICENISNIVFCLHDDSNCSKKAT